MKEDIEMFGDWKYIAEMFGAREDDEREREIIKIMIHATTVNFHVWKYTVAKYKETSYFKGSAEGKKYPIKAKCSYYQLSLVWKPC